MIKKASQKTSAKCLEKMEMNFAFSRKSHPQKSILAARDFLGFFIFEFSMQKHLK